MKIAKVLSAGLVVLICTQTGAFSFFQTKNKKLKGARNMMQAIFANPRGFYIGKDRLGTQLLVDSDQRDDDKISANILTRRFHAPE